MSVFHYLYAQVEFINFVMLHIMIHEIVVEWMSCKFHMLVSFEVGRACTNFFLFCNPLFETPYTVTVLSFTLFWTHGHKMMIHGVSIDALVFSLV